MCKSWRTSLAPILTCIALLSAVVARLAQTAEANRENVDRVPGELDRAIGRGQQSSDANASQAAALFTELKGVMQQVKAEDPQLQQSPSRHSAALKARRTAFSRPKQR